MKNFIKLAVFTGLIISSQAIMAKNKDQVFIQNNYGDNVIIHIDWRSEVPPHLHAPQDLFLQEHEKNSLIKAPTSKDHLFSIDVAPQSNVIRRYRAGLGAEIGTGGAIIATGSATTAAGLVAPMIAVGAAGTGIAYAITHSLNHHTMRAHGNTFFVIENTGKASKVAGQKQISLKGYKSKKHYEEEILKSQTKNIPTAALAD